MRILLTGSSGYIGSRLAPLLKQQGHYLVGVDRDPLNVPLDDFIRCDLLDCGSYSNVLPDIDCICHLAAAKGDWGISRQVYYRDNVEVTRALISAAQAANVRKWIFYSTVSAVGPSSTPVGEEAARKPTTTYGTSKAVCEELFEKYVAQTADALVVTLRPSVVFGPENPSNTNIFRLIDAIHRNRFVMVGRGQEVKTTSYIENLLDAHLFLMERRLGAGGTGHEIYHYVDTPGETTASHVASICALLGKRPSQLRLPLVLAAPIALIGDGVAAITGVDLPITSARVRKFCTASNFSADRIRQLGFEQRVDNQDALRRTVDWYLKCYLTTLCEPVVARSQT